MLTDNKVILQWLNKVSNSFEWRMIFKLGKIDLLKLSAWPPEIYKAIEDAGLWRTFTMKLCDICYPELSREEVLNTKLAIHKVAFECTRSTPAQRARALAQTLREVG